MTNKIKSDDELQFSSALKAPYFSATEEDRISGSSIQSIFYSSLFASLSFRSFVRFFLLCPLFVCLPLFCSTHCIEFVYI